MTIPGDVLRYFQFQFDDGSRRDKLFIILNTSDISGKCIALKTTSHPERYTGCIRGCNPNRKCFFAPNAWQTCFTCNTYIQLPQIFEFETKEIIEGCLQKRMELIQSISGDCLHQLKACLAGFKDDLSVRHWDMIYKGK